LRLTKKAAVIALVHKKPESI